MKIISINGRSGSGKTTVSEVIKQYIKELGYTVDIINLDCFYKSKCDNYDIPEAFDWELLKMVLHKLSIGENVYIPRYNFYTHKRDEIRDSFNCVDVLIIEGIFANITYTNCNLWTPLLCSRHNIRLTQIYVHTRKDICLLRRIDRDTKSRGRSINDILEQWSNQVVPSIIKYIDPDAKKCNYIIENNYTKDDLIQRTKVILSNIQEFLTKQL